MSNPVKSFRLPEDVLALLPLIAAERSRRMGVSVSPAEVIALAVRRDAKELGIEAPKGRKK